MTKCLILQSSEEKQSFYVTGLLKHQRDNSRPLIVSIANEK